VSTVATFAQKVPSPASPHAVEFSDVMRNRPSGTEATSQTTRTARRTLGVATIAVIETSRSASAAFATRIRAREAAMSSETNAWAVQ